MSVDEASPQSDTEDVAAERGLSRRLLLGGGAAALAAVSTPLAFGGTAVGAATSNRDDRGDRRGGAGRSALGFAAVPPNVDDAVIVPEGYVAQVLIPWGDPIQPDGPAFRFDGTNTAAEQAQQFGRATTAWRSSRGQRKRGLLVVNHEALDSAVSLFPTAADYTDPETVLQGAERPRRQRVRTRVGSRTARGASCARATPGGSRQHADGAHRPGRRSSIAADAADPTGTRRARHGQQLRQRLDAVGHVPDVRGELQRLLRHGDAVHADGADGAVRHRRGRRTRGGWRDPRFDLAANPNEPNRFGWVVEIDPGDPGSTPKKRTALGRLKHENAGFAEADDGRAVIYTGDDERFQYLYKFVSARPWRSRRAAAARSTRARCTSPASTPTAPAPGCRSSPGAVPGYGSLADILIDTRGAAAAVGATPMDRPEWVAVHPFEPGVAYGTFTNNTNRTTTDAANPRPNNAFGHILRWQNAGGDHGADDVRVVDVRPRRRRAGHRRRLDASRRATRSAHPTDWPSTPTAGCGSRPTAASPCRATTRCSPPTRSPATSAGSSSARRAARSPAGR